MALDRAGNEESTTVRMRVTAKGHGVIHTGVYDEVARAFGRYAQDHEFACPVENVAAYEARGIAVRVPDSCSLRPATISAQPGTPQTIAVRDPDAVARLALRSLRDAQTGCLVWQGSKANGAYGQICYRRTMYRTHRLSWIAHHGPVPAGHYVCHRCDNPACIAIEHLFLGTPGENYRDMRKKGRLRYNAKLSTDDVAAIKQRLSCGERVAAVAADYAVGYGQVLAIKNGRAWRDIEPRSDKDQSAASRSNADGQGSPASSAHFISAAHSAGDRRDVSTSRS